MPKEEEVVSEEEIIKEMIKALEDENAQSNVIYALARIGEPTIPFARKLLLDIYLQ